MEKQNKNKGIVHQINDIEHYGVPKLEDIDKVVKDALKVVEDALLSASARESNNISLIASERGADTFDTEMVISTVDHEQLKSHYREVREKLYDTKQKYRKLTSNKLIKFLIWIGIIN